MMPMSSCFVTRGGAGTLDTQTVTNATTTTGSSPYYNWAGYRSASPTLGSRSDGTSNLYGGASVVGLYFMERNNQTTDPYFGITYDYYDLRQVVFEVNGTVSNTGWSKMTAGSTVYNRADAVFTTDGSKSIWTWNQSIPNSGVSGSPGPFSGATTDCVFT